MANVSITLTGTLFAKPATCNGAGFAGSTGPSLALGLRPDVAAADIENSSTRSTINSPGAFEPIPLPAGFAGTLFYIRTESFPAGWTLRITYAVSGAVTLPIHGTMLVEAPAADRITGVELQGAGSYAWFASGSVTV